MSFLPKLFVYINFKKSSSTFVSVTICIYYVYYSYICIVIKTKNNSEVVNMIIYEKCKQNDSNCLVGTSYRYQSTCL